MAVLARDPYAGTRGRGRIQQWCGGCIQLMNQPLQVASLEAESLRVVIKVRQIHQGQVGPFCSQDFRGTAGDPRRTGEAGYRSPKSMERKCSQLFLQALRQALRRAVDSKELVAVGPVI